MSIQLSHKYFITSRFGCQVDTHNSLWYDRAMNTKKKYKREYRFPLGPIPDDLKAFYEKRAEENGRSLNQEILQILKRVKLQAEKFNADLP